MDCGQFFAQHADDSQVCKALQIRPEAEQVGWEQQTASPHSPGPVHNSEALCRQVVDPTHYDSVTGDITPTFFNDASSRGASCHRLAHTSEEKIFEMTLARIATHSDATDPQASKKAIGYAVMQASDVRNIKTSAGRRGAGIYDTAKVDDRSHADICQLVSGKQDGKSVRAQLWELAKGALVRFKDEPPAPPPVEAALDT